MIRPARWDDRPDVLRLIVAMGGHEGIARHRDPLRWYGAVLSDPDARAFVAERDGAIVGYCELQAYASSANDRREARLHAVAVAPDMQRSGVGRELIAAANEAARELGCAAMILDSSMWRTGAHDFYRALAFTEHTPAARFWRAVTPSAGTLDDRFLAAAAAAASAVRAAIAGLASEEPLRVGADGAPTEAADDAAERAALEHLLPLGIPIVSEEAGLVGTAAIDPAEPWISLDPLDGSRNYRAGYSSYATSIALVAGGRPRAGVVVDLVAGHRWSASVGGGAWRDGRRLQTTTGGLVAMPSSGGDDGRLTAVPEVTRMRVSGSTALDLCRVADGSLAAYVGLDRAVVHVHDLAAAFVILIEAGGVVLDADGAVPILVPDPVPCLRIVAAGSAALAHRIRTAS